jgi:hypothetical protein
MATVTDYYHVNITANLANGRWIPWSSTTMTSSNFGGGLVSPRTGTVSAVLSLRSSSARVGVLINFMLNGVAVDNDTHDLPSGVVVEYAFSGGPSVENDILGFQFPVLAAGGNIKGYALFSYTT